MAKSDLRIPLCHRKKNKTSEIYMKNLVPTYVQKLIENNLKLIV